MAKTQAYALTLTIGKDTVVSRKLWKDVGVCAQEGHEVVKVLQRVGIDARFGIQSTSLD